MTKKADPEKNAFCILFTFAHKKLEEDGFVALGGLFSSILGEEGAYDGIPPQCGLAVAGLTDVAVQATYEMVLFRLESEFGPLNCRRDTDGDASDEIWSYASRLGSACSPKIDDFFSHRSKAFDEGHPDQYRDFEGRTLPDTIWYRASAERLAA